MIQELTPRQIVKELDRYIIGQEDAKRAVAIAVRNRWRRLQLTPELAEEVAPKNILMIGPTGVGKTEIARRLAQLINAPFIKVEATKFTEIGYHGRDVDSIVRDLVERAVAMERSAVGETVRDQARRIAEDHILDQLLPSSIHVDPTEPDQTERRQLQAGAFDDRTVEINISERSVPVHVMSSMGLDQMGPEFEQFMERVMPPRNRRQRMPVPKALELLIQQEIDRLVDQDTIHEHALRRCEAAGLVFLDEIDKICGGPFTNSRPSDLMPELQGRFAIRVELKDLSAEDYYRILTEPRNALIKQQIALMRTEGVNLTFTDEAIREMSEMAYRANQILENIGARRLYTICEKVLDDIAFHASDAVNKEVAIERTRGGTDRVPPRLHRLPSDHTAISWGELVASPRVSGRA